MKRMTFLGWGLVAAFLSACATPEATGGGAKVGLLRCNTVPGTRVNLFIHSKTDITCTFKNANGNVENYTGETGMGLGLDLQHQTQETIAFSVLSASSNVESSAFSLAGKFVGAKAGATAGVGAGAAVLIGVGEQNLTLQPLALSSSQGFGVTGGLGYLFLEPADGTAMPKGATMESGPQEDPTPDL